MNIAFRAVAASIFLAAPSFASTIGQPLLIIEDDLVGSTIDVFSGAQPSGNNEVQFSGTVSSSVGAPDLVGASFTFGTSFFGFADEQMTMALNGEVVQGALAGRDAAFFSSFGVDRLLYELTTTPPVASASTDPLTPGLSTFLYAGAYAAFGPNVASSPELTFGIEVILDGPLEVRPFTLATGDIIGFVDGPISVARINVGIVGGPPVPPIPLPAGGLLLLSGLGGIAFFKRRENRRA